MVWTDGSNFIGTWKNDQRLEGTMIMNNNCIYIGKFKNDKFNDSHGRLLMPSMVIYQGRFIGGQTCPIGFLLYPDGSMYYGQQAQFLKNGVGKLIDYDGSFQEGNWDNDKLSG